MLIFFLNLQILHIFFQLPNTFENTQVQLLRQNNVGVVIRDERDLNVLCVRAVRPPPNLIIIFDFLILISSIIFVIFSLFKEKENANTRSKGKEKAIYAAKGKENACQVV